MQHLMVWTKVHPFITEFSMTSITAKNTKAEILAEALPLIDDQADKIQTLTEKLNAALILLGFTAVVATIF
tara:strand:+ start:53 stop:265 length:213 start_codon:yes stop_codon:yes gene_type:complete